MQHRWTAGVIAVMLALSGCAATKHSEHEPTANASAAGAATHHSASAKPVKQLPLRPGERRTTLRLPTAYTPSAPYGQGTDDYRCFLLDPKLTKPAFLTGYNVLPDNVNVVHHVILFKADPDRIDAARRLDKASPGPGWTCFGNSGIEKTGSIDDAPWLGAWAPGGSERRYVKGFGMPLKSGTQVIVQMHYNLLQNPGPDQSSVALRLARAGGKVKPLHTFLAVAPVELPCRPGHKQSELCDREAATADVRARFGAAGNTADLLHLLCGEIKPGRTQSCARNANRAMTIRAVAGHMHLLGSRIKVELLPAGGGRRTLLDLKPWNFDNQEAMSLKRPVKVQPFDKIKVTCTHSQRLRDLLPAFESQREDRYVVWGEGSTDEMCLGIIVATYE